MKTRLTNYTVVGRRGMQFPMDMLRYDMAWPIGTLDAHKIEALIASLMSDQPQSSHFTEEDGKTIKIHCQSASPTGPNIDRWRSFGWYVNDVEKV